MNVEFDLEKEERSIIKVIGVGGGGCNAVNHMFEQGIIGVDFANCNTDNQSLQASPVPIKIQLGPKLTDGRGAGSKPDVGREACIESIDEIKNFLSDGTKMLFVACGMGGGTGTGAAPIIAKAAREMGILTIGIVTLPFGFEGGKRRKFADEGLNRLKESVDACIVVSNDRLRTVYGNLPLSHAFGYADNILATAAKGIAEIITVSGYINVDFEDVNTVMRDSGMAIMGIAEASGENRALVAVEHALNSPLLEDNDINGATDILLNISSGNEEITFDEVTDITEYIRKAAGEDVNIIWGSSYDQQLEDAIMVTIIATGFDVDDEDVAIDLVEDRAVEEEHPLTTPVQEDIEEPRIVVSLEDSFDDNDEAPRHRGQDSYTMEDRRNVLDMEVTNQMEEVVRNRYTDQEPFVSQKTFTRERKDEDSSLDKIKSIYLSNISELENQPAYIRKRIKLDEVDKSSEFKRSTTVVNVEGDLEIRKENPYLYDNVD